MSESESLIVPFQVEGRDIRGRVVRLGAVVDEILEKHQYPDGVATLLAHALTLAAMLGSSLKFDGKMTLQAKGDGPVTSIVADFSTPGDLRGWVGFDQDGYEKAVAGGIEHGREVPQLMGGGYLAFTIDQGADMERYQGIVPLEGGTLADCARKYFENSEQLPTAIKLSAGKVGDEWCAGGIMVQRLAASGKDERAAVSAAIEHEAEIEEHWREATVLMATTRDEELLSPEISIEDLLFRLYHENGVRVFKATPLGVLCQCTRDHIASVLGQFDDTELDDMVVDGKIIVTCEFCNKDFDFAPGAHSSNPGQASAI